LSIVVSVEHDESDGDLSLVAHTHSHISLAWPTCAHRKHNCSNNYDNKNYRKQFDQRERRFCVWLFHCLGRKRFHGLWQHCFVPSGDQAGNVFARYVTFAFVRTISGVRFTAHMRRAGDCQPYPQRRRRDIFVETRPKIPKLRQERHIPCAFLAMPLLTELDPF